MKSVSKVIITLSTTALILTSCGLGGGSVTDNKLKRNAITAEQKELSNKMIAASKNLTTSQVIGNTSFVSHGQLTIKYGTEEKNLTLTKTFAGKDGFVALDNLKPNTQYFYEIFDGATRISVGNVKTQK